MFQKLKPYLVAFVVTGITASSILYFVQKRLESDFKYRLAASKRYELRIPQDLTQAYQEGFLECMRSLNPNVYSAYLHCIIEYGADPISDEQFNEVAKDYNLGEYQLDFVKVLLFTSSSSDTTQVN